MVNKNITTKILKFAGGDSNLYGYVLQDPVNFIDPTGLVCVDFDFNAWADYVRDNRFDMDKVLASLTAQLAVGGMPKSAFELGHAIGSDSLGRVDPNTNQMSRWSGRLKRMNIISNQQARAIRDFGRGTAGKILSRATSGLVIVEGFYDWWVIGKGAWDATSFDSCECQ